VRTGCHYSNAKAVHCGDLYRVGGAGGKFRDLKDAIVRIFTDFLTVNSFEFTGDFVVDHDSVAENLVTAIKLRCGPSD
jgi:hypothetical protein